MKTKKWITTGGLLAGALGGGWGCEGQHAVIGESESPASAADGGPQSTLVGSVTFYIDQLLPGPIDEVPARCLPRTLQLGLDGRPDCVILEATPPSSGECSCDGPGRAPARGEAADATREQLRSTGICDYEGGPACADHCVCEVLPATGSSEAECLNAVSPSPDASGWCYIAPGHGNPELIASCPETSPQILRFLEQFPDDAVVVMMCADQPWRRPVAPLGAPCLPESELDARFAGFSVAEVVVELGSDGCESGICLAHHFQGRVSCLYGQAESEGLCTIPGSGTPVSVGVQAQLRDRPAATNVICSCRCDGPGAGPFCACPAGMQCAPVIDQLGFSGEESYAGSYCIPNASVYDAASPLPNGTCTRSGVGSNDGNCGPTPQF